MVEEGQNQPHELPLKRIRFEEIRSEEDEDRISRLPDCLLVEILSRLPATKCAVKTGTLSKRWEHIWTSVPNLIFIHRDNPSADFVSFLDKTVSQRGQLNLKNLTLYCSYNDRFEPHVRNWICYAINCNVEEVNIMLWDPERLIRFQLDNCFLINSCFTDLTLRGCEFNPSVAISWEKLRSLCIRNAYLDEDLIENIISGSPVSESLMLKECAGYKRLNITSQSVKNLVFDRYTANGNIFCDYLEDVIEINAPSILSLIIQNDLLLRKILLVNVSSLVEVDLDYFYHGHYETTFKEAEEEFLRFCLVWKLKVSCFHLT